MSFLSNSSPLNWNTKLKGLKRGAKLGDTGRELGFIGGKPNTFTEGFQMPNRKRPSQVAVRKLAEEDTGKTIQALVERGANERAKTRLALQPHQGWATGKTVHKKTLKGLVKEASASPEHNVEGNSASPGTVGSGSAHTVRTGETDRGLQPGRTPGRPSHLRFSPEAGGGGGGGEGEGGEEEGGADVSEAEEAFERAKQERNRAQKKSDKEGSPEAKEALRFAKRQETEARNALKRARDFSPQGVKPAPKTARLGPSPATPAPATPAPSRRISGATPAMFHSSSPHLVINVGPTPAKKASATKAKASPSPNTKKALEAIHEKQQKRKVAKAVKEYVSKRKKREPAPPPPQPARPSTSAGIGPQARKPPAQPIAFEGLNDKAKARAQAFINHAKEIGAPAPQLFSQVNGSPPRRAQNSAYFEALGPQERSKKRPAF